MLVAELAAALESELSVPPDEELLDAGSLKALLAFRLEWLVALLVLPSSPGAATLDAELVLPLDEPGVSLLPSLPPQAASNINRLPAK